MRKARITVVESVYHQLPDGQPLAVESRFGGELASEDVPYVRTSRATPEWKPLDCGWVERASMLVLTNAAGRAGPRNITDDAKVELSRMVVQVSFDGATVAVLVKPRQSARFQPADLKSVFVRCVVDCPTVVQLFPE